MDLVLDIGSSVEFWRKLYPLDRTPKAVSCVIPSDCATLQKDVWNLVPQNEAEILAYYGVLHVLSLDNSKRGRSSNHKTHYWRGKLPESAFYQLKPNVFVESPEFMFLHAATFLDFRTLIAFGDELCGFYSFDDREERGIRVRKKPLTTKEKLSHFLQMARGCSGVNNAMRALPYIVDRSVSPMETYDEMTMCLTYRLGGYGLLMPTMNEEVRLTPRAAQIARRNTCYLDMGYRDYNLDIEHHGKLDHSSDEDYASDRARVNGLKEMGIEVIELTYEQVDDLFTYELIIERIAKILGKRIKSKYKGATEARLGLRKTLKNWNRSSGRIR